MKTILFGLLVLMVLAAPPSLRAQSGQGYGYSVNPDGTTITITSYSGPGGVVAIPTNINNLTVTSIGDNAFNSHSNLASVVIPATVTNIGNSAFYLCRLLNSVAILGSVTTIGDYAFYFCYNLGSIVIPSGATTIGNYAFAYCVALGSVTIPASVTNLGEYSFAYCPSPYGHNMYFLGNAPAADTTVFYDNGTTVAIYLPGYTGWSNVLGGAPTQVNYVSFHGGPTFGWGPLTVQFQSAGTDAFGNPITNWNWSFGDGSTSTNSNPSHTYTAIGNFYPALIATNNAGGAAQGMNTFASASILVMNQTPYTNLVLNGGFESGGFDYWNGAGAGWDFSVDNGTYGLYSQISPHSGNFDADLLSDGSGEDAYLSQILFTTPGANYEISFWFRNDSYNYGEFFVSWDGNTIFDTEDQNFFGVTDWTQMQFKVSATGSSTVLQFGFYNFNSILALDDISVAAVAPAIASLNVSGTDLTINAANGVAGATNYVLTSTNVAQPLGQWTPVATNVLGANGNFSVTATNAVAPNAAQQFYILRTQ